MEPAGILEYESITGKTSLHAEFLFFFFFKADAVHMERTSANVYMCFFICINIFVTDFCSGQVLKVVKCLGAMKQNTFCGYLYHSWGEMKFLIIKVCIPLNSKRPACYL